MNIYRGKHVDKRIFIEQYADIIQISDKECIQITHTVRLEPTLVGVENRQNA